MVLSENDLSFSEVSTSPMPFEAVVFGKDYPSLHAKTMGNHSGVPFTEQRQLDMYRKLEGQSPDQITYVMVLARTSGLVEVFKAKYPHIYFPNELEL